MVWTLSWDDGETMGCSRVNRWKIGRRGRYRAEGKVARIVEKKK